jgi:hypothetical protein
MDENAVNPYQSPLASLTGESVEPGAAGTWVAYKLYSAWAVCVATVMGGPLAGGIIMAINYRRLGEKGKAVHAIVWTAVAMAAFCVVGAIFEDMPNLVFMPPQWIGMYLAAKAFQGPAMTRHELGGNLFDSAWVAAGIGLACGIALFAVILAGAIVFAG